MKTKKRIVTSLASLLVVGPMAGSAGAAVIINIVDDGTDTTITASGTLNVTDLTLNTTGGAGGINPSAGFLELTNNAFEVYQGITGPADFGTGGFQFLSSATGDRVGIRLGFGNALTVPENYVSGALLSAEGSITGQGLTEIGITPGTSTWTWGSGANADSLTINASVIPEPSSFLLGSLGLFALIAKRRRF